MRKLGSKSKNRNYAVIFFLCLWTMGWNMLDYICHMESAGCPPIGNDHPSKASAQTWIINAANIYYLPGPRSCNIHLWSLPAYHMVGKEGGWMDGWKGGYTLSTKFHVKDCPVFSLLFLPWESSYNPRLLLPHLTSPKPPTHRKETFLNEGK